MALAAALTVGMLTLFASFGGVGYATSAADSFSVTKMARIIGVAPKAKHAKKAKKHAAKKTSASRPAAQTSGGLSFLKNDAQEGPDDVAYKPGKGCGDKNHVHARENECK